MSTYGNQTPPYDAAYRLRHPIFAAALLHLPLNEPNGTPILDLRNPSTLVNVTTAPNQVNGATGTKQFTNSTGSITINRPTSSWTNFTLAFSVSDFIGQNWVDIEDILSLVTLDADGGDLNNIYGSQGGPFTVSMAGSGGQAHLQHSENPIPQTTGIPVMHVCMTFDQNADYQLYTCVNGVDYDEDNHRISNNQANYKTITIGKTSIPNNRGSSHTCTLGNVVVWDRVLSQAERISWSSNPFQYFVKDISGGGGRRSLNRARGL